jgi:hypothetical protein
MSDLEDNQMHRRRNDNGLPIRLILALIPVFSVGPAAAQEIKSRDELIGQLRQGWEQLRKWDEANKQFVVKKEQQNPGGPVLRSIVHVRMNMGQGCRSSENQPVGTENVAIYSRNAAYAFLIYRDKSKSGDAAGWKLSSYDPTPLPANTVDLNILNSANLPFFYPLSRFDDRLLPDILSDANFNVEGFSIADRGRYRVVYTYKLRFPLDKKMLTRKGSLVVDPELSWAVVEDSYEFEGRAGRSTIKREIERGPNAGRGLLCRSIQEDFSDGGRTLTFADYSFEESPEELFRLSHYDLPEPIDAPPLKHRTTRVWWIVGGAIVCLALAIMFVHLARRMRQRANPDLRDTVCSPQANT